MLKQRQVEDFSSKYHSKEASMKNNHVSNANHGSRYWFGSPDEDGRNLATCVWRSQEDARIGSVGEAHRKAAGATRYLYTEW